MLNKCKEQYNLFVIVVLSSGEEEFLHHYLDSHNISFMIINYNSNIYQHELKQIHQRKIFQPKYVQIKRNYLKSNNDAKQEIYNVDFDVERFSRQFHQLQIGLETMQELENQHQIKFDMVMKTRFDVYYPPDFYPHGFDSSESVERKLLFNDTNLDLFQQTIKKYNIHNIPECLEFIKQQFIQLPKARINFDMINMTFGGWNFYNSIAVENIMNGSNNVLYAFNDFFYFARRDVFIKLKDLFKDCFQMDPIWNIHHIYAPESQLIMYCLKHKIDILMYDDGSLDYSGSFGLIR
jgi:hypothetical protein